MQNFKEEIGTLGKNQRHGRFASQTQRKSDVGIEERY